MLAKKFLIVFISVISMLSAASQAQADGREREPNPPRYPGDNPPPRERPPREEPPNRPEPPRERPPREEPPYRPEPPRERPPRQEPPYRPEPPRHEPPPYYPPPRQEPPRQPPPYYPPPSDPGYPSQPGNGEFRRVIQLNRTVANESLPLRSLARLGSEFNGYQVLAVEVEMSYGSYANADLQLLVNGMVEDYQRANDNFTTLTPQHRALLGYDVSSLRLDVRGQVNIRSISVVLSGGSSFDPGPRVETVVVNVFRHLWNDSQLDLSQFVDLNRYGGYSVDSMTVNATPDGGSGIIDVIVSGVRQATISLSPYSSDYPVNVFGHPQLGYSNSLVLLTRGQMTVNTVTLNLVRTGR